MTGTLARRYGLNRTTVTKWRQATMADTPMELIAPHSTVLCPKEKAIVATVRRRAPCCCSTTCPDACVTAPRR